MGGGEGIISLPDPVSLLDPEASPVETGGQSPHHAPRGCMPSCAQSLRRLGIFPCLNYSTPMKFSPLSIGILSAVFLAACTGSSSHEQRGSSSSVSSMPLTMTLSSSSESSSSLSAAAFDPASLVAYSDKCTKPLPPLDLKWRYEDAEHGAVLWLPDTGDTGVPDYTKNDIGLQMGPMVSFDDGTGPCKTEHAFMVRYLPKRGAEEAQRAIVDEYASFYTENGGAWGVNLVMVDRRAAVQWGIGDWVCPMPALEIPGTKYNVQLSVSCHYPKTPLQAAQDLEAIMQKMEFTGAM